jgi:hypothetical protein
MEKKNRVENARHLLRVEMGRVERRTARSRVDGARLRNFGNHQCRCCLGRATMKQWKATMTDLFKNLTGQHVVIGPLVWQPSDGKAGKVWYFVLVLSYADKGLRIIRLDADRKSDRTLMLRTMAQQKLPVTVHDMGDELEMAKLCEVIWPCERTSRIRATVQAEYAAGLHAPESYVAKPG